MFSHSGRVRRDSDEESAFMALSISMTTKMERDMVEAERAEALVKMSQFISGNAVAHWW